MQQNMAHRALHFAATGRKYGLPHLGYKHTGYRGCRRVFSSTRLHFCARFLFAFLLLWGIWELRFVGIVRVLCFNTFTPTANVKS